MDNPKKRKEKPKTTLEKKESSILMNWIWENKKDKFSKRLFAKTLNFETCNLYDVFNGKRTMVEKRWIVAFNFCGIELKNYPEIENLKLLSDIINYKK